MGVIGGGDRHYRGRGMPVHAGLGGVGEDGFVASRVVGETPGPGAPTAWKCPSCQTANISVQEEGCPSCGAGTARQAEVAKALREENSLTPDQISQILFGLAEVGSAELGAWAQCLRGPAQLTLCRALAHYAEHGTPGLGELKTVEIVSWARAVMPAGE